MHRTNSVDARMVLHRCPVKVIDITSCPQGVAQNCLQQACQGTRGRLRGNSCAPGSGRNRQNMKASLYTMQEAADVAALKAGASTSAVTTGTQQYPRFALNSHCRVSTPEWSLLVNTRGNWRATMRPLLGKHHNACSKMCRQCLGS